MRLGNLSAAQRRFWIQCHYKKTGIDARYSRIFRSRGMWAGMMGHRRESHRSAGIYARIQYRVLVLHIFFKGHTSYTVRGQSECMNRELSAWHGTYLSSPNAGITDSHHCQACCPNREQHPKTTDTSIQYRDRMSAESTELQTCIRPTRATNEV